MWILKNTTNEQIQQIRKKIVVTREKRFRGGAKYATKWYKLLGVK